MNVKWKAILSVMFIILSVSLFFIHMLYSNGIENLENSVQLKVESSRLLAKTIENEASDKYRKRIKNFVNPSFSSERNRMIKAFANRDREQLVKIAKPVYNVLKKENRYFRSLGFITPDNKVFSRVHLPNLKGDNVGKLRSDIASVNKYRKQVYGYQVGLKSVQFRIIEPVAYDGQHVGVAQFGIDARFVLDSLNHTMFVASGMVVNHHEFDHQPHEKKYDEIETLPTVNTSDYTLLGDNQEFLKQINQYMDWDESQKTITINGKSLIVVKVLPVQNFQKRTIGHYFIVLDVTEILLKNKKRITSVIFLSVLITVFSFLILYISYGRLVQSIVNLNSKLEESNQSLENRVIERTKELETREKEYKDLVEHSNSIVLKWDSEGKIKFLNSYGLQLFGYKADEVIGKSIMTTLVDSHETTGRNLKLMVDDILNNPNEYLLNVNENVCKNGDVIWVQWSNKAVYDDNNNFLEMLSIGIDITDVKRLEAELRQSQKMEAIGTLAGGIAHDFNNILAAIFGYTDISLLKLSKDSEVRPYVEQIQKASYRAKELVQQILAFSRKTELGKDIVDVGDAVTESLKLIRSSIPTTVNIHQSIKEDVYIVADQTQIHQVVMNLCTNSFHALEDNGGDLSITLDVVNASRNSMDEGEYAYLQIQDNGTGMDKATVAKIFEPYFTTKSQGKGTGLGLAVVHGIIKSFSGHIYVKSEINVGTTFDIYFPISKATPMYDTDSDSAEGADLFGTENIWIVDDEVDILKYTNDYLAEFGYSVYTFESGNDALKLLESNTVECDVLITDFTMPGMTGLELASCVREVKPFVPILLSSGYGEGIDQQQMAEAGIDSYIQKPLNVIQLLKKVRVLLEKSKGRGK